MRRGKMLGLLWRDMDLEKRVAFLPITRNGESRGVPLSSRAVAVLILMRSSTDSSCSLASMVRSESPDGAQNTAVSVA